MKGQNEEMSSSSGKRWKMYIAGLSACLGSMAIGAAMGYSSPALVSMAKNESNFEPLDKDQKTWIGSIMTFGALFGGLLAGPLIDRVGRRSVLLFSAVPFILGWMLIAFSGKFVMMLIGRLITGICSGALSLVVPVYLSESASADIRGFFGSYLQLFAFIGTLISFGLGIVIEWKVLALILSAIPLILAIFIFFMPESPRYLLFKGRRDDAIKAIEFLYGSGCDADSICKEMEQTFQNQTSGSISWREAMKPSILKPLVLSLMLMVFQQWSGFNGVQFYAGDIFIESGFDSFDPLVCAIFLGVAQTLSTFASSFLIDRFGRRLLLLVSGGGMAIGVTALAIFFIVKDKAEEDVTENYGWITVVSLVVYCAAFAIGYGPIAWLMMGEILPARVKGPASSISTAFNWLNAFLVTKTIELMKSSMTIYGTYLFYAAICVIGCLFVIFFLPETKGKTLEEIESFFESGKKNNSDSKSQLNDCVGSTTTLQTQVDA